MRLFWKTVLVSLSLGILFSSVTQGKDALSARQALVAKFAASVKLDGKLGDPAWANAPEYPFELCEHAYDREPEHLQRTLGNELREKGSVRFLWNQEYLYVGAKLNDIDVVAEGKEDQTHLYQMGDLVEVFLKPENETYYWEVYGAPNNRKTCFFFPGRGRLFIPSCAEYSCAGVLVSANVDGTLNDWRDKDKGWTVEIAIPVKMLTAHGARFDNAAKWTVLIGRYNYSKYLPMKENSSVPRISAPNFHLHEDYARLVFEQ